MKWIDQNFYTTEYCGVDISTDEFTPIANSAERLIDQLTQFRLSQTDFTTYTPQIQQMVKMAISAQIEYFYEMGASTEAGLQTIKSASIGGFSYTNPTSEDNTKTLRVSEVAMDYLSYTGLMYAGIGIVSRGIGGSMNNWGMSSNDN